MRLKNRTCVLVLVILAATCVLAEGDVEDGTQWREEEVVLAYGEDEIGSDKLDGYYVNEHVNVFQTIFEPSLLAALLKSLDGIDNELCRNHSKIFLKELNDFKLWAVKMFDSSSKLPDGIINGRAYQLGDFDECVEVRVDLDEHTELQDVHLQGQYCLADIEFAPREDRHRQYYAPGFLTKYNFDFRSNSSAWDKLMSREIYSTERRNKLHWAFCIPSSCTSTDLESSLRKALHNLGDRFDLDFHVKVDSNLCQIMKNVPYTKGDIAVCLIIGVLVTLLLVSTAYDVLILQPLGIKDNDRKTRSTKEMILMSFSLYTNGAKLFSTNVSREELAGIHGIRFWTMLLIIIGHRCMFTFGAPALNPEIIERETVKIQNMLFLNGPLIVDTFFVLSGFLVCYLMLLELDKKKKVNIPLMYLYRYLRLTPTYIMIVAFYATLFYKTGSGPFWEIRIGVERERCAQNWWANLLYINNYVNTESLCMFQSWFVTCDMHYFLVAPIIIYLVWKKRFTGRVLLFLITAGGIIIPMVVTYYFRLDPLLLLHIRTLQNPIPNETFQQVYIRSHTRFGAYLGGINAGYISYLVNKGEMKITNSVNIACWIASPILLLSAIFSGWIFYWPDRPYFVFEAAFFSGFHRLAWTTGIAMIVAGMAIGKGACVNAFFSWKAWIPLSRLTYCAFLVHGAIQMFTAASIRTPEYLSFFKLFWMGAADIVYTFGIALFVSLTFEFPINALQSICCKREINPANKVQNLPPVQSILSLSVQNNMSDLYSRSVPFLYPTGPHDGRRISYGKKL